MGKIFIFTKNQFRPEEKGRYFKQADRKISTFHFSQVLIGNKIDQTRQLCGEAGEKNPVQKILLFKSFYC